MQAAAACCLHCPLRSLKRCSTVAHRPLPPEAEVRAKKKGPGDMHRYTLLADTSDQGVVMAALYQKLAQSSEIVPTVVMGAGRAASYLAAVAASAAGDEGATSRSVADAVEKGAKRYRRFVVNNPKDSAERLCDYEKFVSTSVNIDRLASGDARGLLLQYKRSWSDGVELVLAGNMSIDDQNPPPGWAPTPQSVNGARVTTTLFDSAPTALSAIVRSSFPGTIGDRGVYTSGAVPLPYHINTAAIPQKLGKDVFVSGVLFAEGPENARRLFRERADNLTLAIPPLPTATSAYVFDLLRSSVDSALANGSTFQIYTEQLLARLAVKVFVAPVKVSTFCTPLIRAAEAAVRDPPSAGVSMKLLKRYVCELSDLDLADVTTSFRK